MSLNRFFRRKSLKQSGQEQALSDHVQIKCWHKFVEAEEGTACVALTMDHETRLIYCNYAGNIKKVLRLQSHEDKLQLELMNLGKHDFICQYVSYKPIIKKNLELLFEPISTNQDRLRPFYAAYEDDVKALVWNLFSDLINYEEQEIGWGKLQNCLKLRLNFDKPEQPRVLGKGGGRGRGNTV